jgi:predicted dehydrogenase
MDIAADRSVIGIAVIGLGLIGRERLKAVDLLRRRGLPVSVTAVLDPLAPDADSIAAEWGARVCRDLDALIAAAPDLIIVATPHDTAVRISERLLAAGHRVLMEKPLGRTEAEARRLLDHRAAGASLFVGYNYRFFEGVAALCDDIRADRFGAPISLSLLIGHGGNPRDAASWKLDPMRAGGGCLIDPGVHLLDLVHTLNPAGVTIQGGTVWRGFWNTGIEEDCALVMAGTRIPSIDLRVSVIRWRSTFRIEFFGTEGYGLLEGRGRSYGPQIYRRGRRWGWQTGGGQADSEETVVTTNGESVFADELAAILFASSGGHRGGPATAAQALETMVLLDRCRMALGLPVPATPPIG